jgi:Uma2 family endonuclease
MTVAIPKSAEPRTRRWTREEYYRLAASGYFEGQRVLLLEGEIIQMPPQGHAHAKALVKVSRWLLDHFTDDCHVRIQMPLNLVGENDPEPDAAVIAGSISAFNDHPRTAMFVIEVSDSSLELDRRKGSLYAAAGVQEYWIVNLPEQTLEVYRNPDTSREQYDAPTILKRGETIAPLARPQAMISVTELLS